jgi:hypothetical protein
VVGIQNELGAIKIGPEMYDSPYNSKTLPLIWIILIEINSIHVISYVWTYTDNHFWIIINNFMTKYVCNDTSFCPLHLHSHSLVIFEMILS